MFKNNKIFVSCSIVISLAVCVLGGSDLEVGSSSYTDGVCESLLLDDDKHTITSQSWLKNCSQVQQLTLQGISVTKIRSVLDRIQVQQLDLIDVTDIDLIVTQPLFTKSVQHQSLTAVHIQFSRLDPVAASGDASWPEVSAALVRQVALLTRLHTLRISNFAQFDFCARGPFPSVKFPSLLRMWLYSTNTTTVCYREYRAMPRLRVLYIEGDTSVDIEFNELLSAPIQTLNIARIDDAFFTHNEMEEIFFSINDSTLTEIMDLRIYISPHISNFHFTRADYLSLFNGSTAESVVLFDFNKPMDCDCHGDILWFARAVRMGMIVAETVNLTCTNGEQVKTISCERVYCKRFACDSPCVCCRDEGGAVFADCRGARLSAFPTEVLHLTDIAEILAPDNRISTLPNSFPDSLLRIDLSGNRISDLPYNTAAALFAKPDRRVRLAGNPLHCTCNNQPLLEAVQHRRRQVEDKETVKCEGSNTTLLELAETCADQKFDAELARERQKSLLIAITVTVTISLIALALGVALYYRRIIKIILYVNGWCLCCLREDELDEDRQYDVFLSFCHADTDIVLSEVLPELDRTYRVCIHLRDWIPGKMIPAQIRTSVENSRRTLVVTSKEYAESLWGLLEFKTAYASGLSERRIRVVMIVMDDVLESPDLNEELKEYVRFNTYVRWGDPWFWSKLRYSLEHHPASRQSVQKQSSASCKTSPPLDIYVSPLKSCTPHQPSTDTTSEHVKTLSTCFISSAELPKYSSEKPSLLQFENSDVTCTVRV